MLDALRSKKLVIFVVIAAIIATLFFVTVSSQEQNAAPTAKAKADVVSGTAPLNVKFNGMESSDPDEDTLTFAWDFGDGTKSTSVNPSKAFTKAGTYSVVLKVNDGEYTVAATPIVISVSDAASDAAVQGASTERSATKKHASVLGTSATTTTTPATNQPATSNPVTPTTPEPNPNLIPNPSFVDPYSDDTPLFWIKGAYGLNIVEFTYETTGRTDDSSVSVTISENLFGDAKWIFEPVAIQGGLTYEFKDWYKSDVQTEILVDYTLDDSSHLYELVGTVAPADDWTEYSTLLVAPDNATGISVQHVISADGTLQVDDYSLVEQ
jgi:PKD repeat protein